MPSATRVPTTPASSSKPALSTAQNTGEARGGEVKPSLLGSSLCARCCGACVTAAQPAGWWPLKHSPKLRPGPPGQLRCFCVGARRPRSSPSRCSRRSTMAPTTTTRVMLMLLAVLAVAGVCSGSTSRAVSEQKAAFSTSAGRVGPRHAAATPSNTRSSLTHVRNPTHRRPSRHRGPPAPGQRPRLGGCRRPNRHTGAVAGTLL
jgi:hypothetical protein